MTTATKNEWSSQGVAVTEVTRQRDLVVRHGRTTDVTNLLRSEISIVRQRDRLVELMDDALVSARVIGSPIRQETVPQIKSIIVGVLESAKGTLIFDYRDVFARQNPDNPSSIDVKFALKVNYPTNYVNIEFAIDTTVSSDALDTFSVGSIF